MIDDDVSEQELGSMIEEVLHRLSRDPEAAHLWHWHARPGCEDEPPGVARRSHLGVLLGLMGATPLIQACGGGIATLDAGRDGGGGRSDSGSDGGGGDDAGSDGGPPITRDAGQDGGRDAGSDAGSDGGTDAGNRRDSGIIICGDDPCACADDPCACADDPCAG
jgi:hypothetical protein